MNDNTLSPQAIHWLDHLDQTQHIHFDLIKSICRIACLHEQTNTPFSLSTLTQGLAMADVLLSVKSDDYAIAAAILYPAIFYNPSLAEKLAEKIDKTVYKLIMGAMQMNVVHTARNDKKEKTGQQNQIDNLRKMMLAMVDDIRTVLLKLSERLVMLQHLGRLNSEQQLQIAQDTLDYYAPLANRLGIGHIKWQLEDWAFRYVNPKEYQKISKAFHMRQKDRVQFIHRTIAELKTLLEENGIKNAKISGRIKHIYSIYKKIQRKETTFDHIYDTNAVRILVPTLRDCYTVLSLVHSRWTPITKEFDDYIAKPKSNDYQSIHTAITHENGETLEIQIRTVEMHEKAELGIAAHWKYKENKIHHATDDHKIHLLRQLIDSQTHLYPEAFHDRVYVFSPTGNVFDLVKGATPLDFAYLVHSDIGNRCRGAKINNVLVPLTYELKTGDHIEIITTKEPHPSRDWLRADLGYLKTTHAKQKVRQWFRKLDQEKYMADGLLIWEKLAKQKHLEKSLIETIVSDFDFKNTDALFTALGNGSIAPTTILNKLIDTPTKQVDEIVVEEEPIKKEKTSSAFSVLGEKHLLTQLAKCCRPIPGDEIMGYITKGRGITVHQKKCRNIIDAKKYRPEKLIDISWENRQGKNYRVNLEVQCEDRAGLLRDISGVIAQLNLSIFALTTRLNKDNATANIALTIEINNISLLNDIMKKIRQIKGVVNVQRK